ncbi:MAG: tRNA lysidine(34) synthetase TilS [Arenicellales bacterium]
MSDTGGIDLELIRSRILDTVGAGPDHPWYAAFSGGVDSTVLLHLLGRIARDTGTRLAALHADHGLSPHSGRWRRHCERQCDEWGVECRSTRLAVADDSGLGPEGTARQARYRWFRDMVGAEHWLFTAHHRNDQAETVIERLARGSGPRGLGGMRPVARVYDLNVARPLLDVSRDSIEAYAALHGLRWVDDESNRDSRITRNYIRSRILPDLKLRWPDTEATLARTAAAMREAQAVLDEVAAADLGRLDDRPVGGDPSVCIPALTALSAERQRNALRCWIHRELGVSLGLTRLNHVIRELACHPRNAGGLRWPPAELRTYRDRLYLVAAGSPPRGSCSWTLQSELVMEGGLTLTPRKVTGRGLKAGALPASVTVQFRLGGESCRLPGRRHRHALKKLLQDAGIPPWQRPRIPLIMVGGEVAAVPGLTCCVPYAAGPDDSGIEIEVSYAGRRGASRGDGARIEV